MNFNLNGNDIKNVIDLIDKFGDNNPDFNHIKNLLLNRRGSKTYSKAQLIEIIKGYKPDYNLGTLQDMDDKKLYNLALKIELEMINYGN